MPTTNSLMGTTNQDRDRSGFGPDPKSVSPARRRSLVSHLAAMVSGVGEGVPEPRSMGCFVAKSRGRITFVRSAEIDWIETANNHVKLHVAGGAHLMRETLANVEARLPPGRFLRISRSAIVNLERIRELQRLPNNGYAIVLKNGDPLSLSRGYRKKVHRL
jgi:two-component system LytT family response regulator